MDEERRYDIMGYRYCNGEYLADWSYLPVKQRVFLWFTTITLALIGAYLGQQLALLDPKFSNNTPDYTALRVFLGGITMLVIGIGSYFAVNAIRVANILVPARVILLDVEGNLVGRTGQGWTSVRALPDHYSFVPMDPSIQIWIFSPEHLDGAAQAIRKLAVLFEIDSTVEGYNVFATLRPQLLDIIKCISSKHVPTGTFDSLRDNTDGQEEILALLEGTGIRIKYFGYVLVKEW